jgi:hypothetical protein
MGGPKFLVYILLSTINVMHKFGPKMGWATFYLVAFFTNSSGHPVLKSNFPAFHSFPEMFLRIEMS